MISLFQFHFSLFLLPRLEADLSGQLFEGKCERCLWN